MSFKKLFVVPLCALTLAGASAPAFALSSTPFTATLEAPAAKKSVSAGGMTWNCEGNTCVARGYEYLNASNCRELATEVGRVQSFATDKKSLAADKLEYCNAKAARPAATETAKN